MNITSVDGSLSFLVVGDWVAIDCNKSRSCLEDVAYGIIDSIDNTTFDNDISFFLSVGDHIFIKMVLIHTIVNVGIIPMKNYSILQAM